MRDWWRSAEWSILLQGPRHELFVRSQGVRTGRFTSSDPAWVFSGLHIICYVPQWRESVSLVCDVELNHDAVRLLQTYKRNMLGCGFLVVVYRIIHIFHLVNLNSISPIMCRHISEIWDYCRHVRFTSNLNVTSWHFIILELSIELCLSLIILYFKKLC
jgi:hypothetical protein